MRRLEDPDWLARRLISAPERQRLEALTLDRDRRKPSDDLADGGEGNRLVGLEPDHADDWCRSFARKNLRQEARLACPRFALDDCGGRQATLTDLAQQGGKRLELQTPTNELATHWRSVILGDSGDDSNACRFSTSDQGAQAQPPSQLTRNVAW
jgi:hypothetical protein